MKQIILTLCVFIVVITSAYAEELYKCNDSKGSPIITSAPQDGMTDCVLKDSDEDSKTRKNKETGKSRVVNAQCDAVSSNMNNARTYLNQASNRKTSELEAGKEDVRKAIDFLSEAEKMSSYCPCPSLSEQISDATQFAQRASCETSVSQFSDSLTKTIRAFNNSQEAFKLCR
jgi:hypothetical protein